ncbi:MAG: hypothetical protein A2493_00310 [Candidatus Magasanikbacteria bacterium RIFOXYC12_FULL_33_11]|uniref:Glycosyltransferase subfamily 4-like N-terminal domain-containing protein n=1 Tax=Candidatus Magasanikbacteria bacterium RIFOXYC12_FULL_33_11 TaxID=1798701 RepID=A0A1F6NQC2_9BACT|nr:MAG: hypothetical protein A2493_00310 [Candidatus Magasanikbacteria bacterium RIFOXYC12_FULL_33_11]
MLKEKNSKLHVVHILPTLDIGGAEMFVLELTKYISEENIKQSILILKDKKAFASEVPENVNLDVLDLSKVSYFKRIFVLKKYLKEISTDVVHTHLFGADLWGRLAAWLLKIPVVTTEHNVNVAESSLRAYIKRLMHNFSQVYTAPSQAVAEYMSQVYRVRLEKIEVIRHGIDIKRFSNIKSNKFHNTIKLAIIGRLTEQKGHKVAIEALTYLSDTNVELDITGSGELKNDLQDYAKKIGVADKINWQEAVTKVEQAYDNADIVLMPSLWEGLGLVALEAMASERLVIASSVDGLKEIIKDGETGLLFQSQDALELSNVIKKSIDDKEKSYIISKNAREWTQKNVRVEDMAKKYQEIYLNLVDR